MDLERDRLAEVLDRTPYDRNAPAFISFAGVIMYLTKTAVSKTMQSVAGYVAGGSEVVFDYLEPAAFSPDAAARVRFAMQRARGLGEPMQSGFDPGELKAMLGSHGLVLREDLGPSEIRAIFLDQMDGYEAVEHHRLARAELDFPPSQPT